MKHRRGTMRVPMDLIEMAKPIAESRARRGGKTTGRGARASVAAVLADAMRAGIEKVDDEEHAACARGERLDVQDQR